MRPPHSLTMRQLFEYNAFHVQQPAYPSGYLFRISEVFEKSPLAAWATICGARTRSCVKQCAASTSEG